MTKRRASNIPGQRVSELTPNDFLRSSQPTALCYHVTIWPWEQTNQETAEENIASDASANNSSKNLMAEVCKQALKWRRYKKTLWKNVVKRCFRYCFFICRPDSNEFGRADSKIVAWYGVSYCCKVCVHTLITCCIISFEQYNYGRNKGLLFNCWVWSVEPISVEPNATSTHKNDLCTHKCFSTFSEIIFFHTYTPKDLYQMTIHTYWACMCQC